MADVTIELNFIPNKPGSTSGTVTVQNGAEVMFVDTVNLARAKARSDYIVKVQEKYPKLDEEKLEKQLMQIVEQQLKQKQQDNSSKASQGNKPLELSIKALEETDPKRIALAKEFLQRPDLISQIMEHARLLGIAGETELIVMIYLIGTSRLLSTPLAGEVMGASSAGKSYVIRQTVRLFPDEAIYQAHRITPRALEHMLPGSLVHRFVVAGERSRLQDDTAAEATRALREMISDGKLTLAIADRNTVGNFETRNIVQDGPIAYIECTTLGISQINDEDRTRFILLSTDEGQEQTSAIVDQMATAAATPQNCDTPDSIIALHHTAQRLLYPHNVVVPFAKSLTSILPKERLEVRRTFGHLLSFVRSVALLHQYQRQRCEQGQIIATLDDYNVVRLYLSGPLARSLGCELTPGAKNLLETIGEIKQFTIPDMVGRTNLSYNTVRGRIKELQNAGQIIKLQESKGQVAAAYAVVDDPPPLNGLILPNLAEQDDKNSFITIPEIGCEQNVTLCE